MSSVGRLQNEGIQCQPEIMIPLVSTVEELNVLKKQIVDTIDRLSDNMNQSLNYSIGTMIETPRACMVADQLAEVCDFFSFGTNDLTQLTYGFSRDDAGKFINNYLNDHILEADPFQTLDKDGVGRMIRTAVELAKRQNPSLKIGVCGELGGDPKSIHFFNTLPLDYVSCSPFRVPGAMLATAQSVVEGDV